MSVVHEPVLNGSDTMRIASHPARRTATTIIFRLTVLKVSPRAAVIGYNTLFRLPSAISDSQIPHLPPVVASRFGEFGVGPVMFSALRRFWSDLKSGRPGSRFEKQYDENRREAKSPVGRVLRIIGGVLLIPLGMFFLAVPGPGLVIIGLGAVLIAREFRFAAKLLDELEVRGRKVWKWGHQRWRRLVQARRKVVSR